jgi:hypothetical protein
MVCNRFEVWYEWNMYDDGGTLVTAFKMKFTMQEFHPVSDIFNSVSFRFKGRIESNSVILKKNAHFFSFFNDTDIDFSGIGMFTTVVEEFS